MKLTDLKDSDFNMNNIAKYDSYLNIAKDTENTDFTFRYQDKFRSNQDKKIILPKRTISSIKPR